MHKYLFFVLFFILFSSTFADEKVVPPTHLDAVVRVQVSEMERGWFIQNFEEGSGTVVSRDGHIVTSYHLVKRIADEPKKYSAIICQNRGQMTEPESSYEAKVAYFDEKKDLALLKVVAIWKMSTENLTYGKTTKLRYEGIVKDEYPFTNHVQEMEEAALDDEVYALGYIGNGITGITLTKAEVNGFEEGLVNMNTALYAQNTGGAVFSANDDFLGMAAHNENIPNGISQYVDANRLSQFLVESDEELNNAQIVESTCGKNTLFTEKKECACKPGFEWNEPENVEIRQCIRVKDEGYCGKDAYRVNGDMCECYEGYHWGSLPRSTVVQCVPISGTDESEEEPAEETPTEKVPTYSWKKLIFEEVDDLKIFGRKVRNGKALLLWKTIDRKKPRGCQVSISDESMTPGLVLFQRKNLALVKVPEGEVSYVEINGCGIEGSEEVFGAKLFITK